MKLILVIPGVGTVRAEIDPEDGHADRGAAAEHLLEQLVAVAGAALQQVRAARKERQDDVR